MDNKNIDYDVLFTPYKIGKVTIKNRIGMSAMGLFSANTDGCLLYTSSITSSSWAASPATRS